jgi:glycosyltransferase involved in cell wall biosynthesis
MNIFYDHSIFQQGYGGISRYFREIIVRLLDKESVNVHLFMGLFLNRYGLEKEKGRYSGYWGWPVPPIRYAGILRRFLNRKGWRLFQAKFAHEGGKGSIYHPTYYDFEGLPRSKVVFTVHDFTHERYSSFFSSKDQTPRMKREAFKRADALICVSESTKNDLLDLYELDAASRIEVVHHGYNDLSSLSRHDILLPGRPFFLFVGPRHSYKNFDCLVKAFASSSELKKDFMLVCFGGAAFSREESNQFQSMGIMDKIIRFEGGDDVLATLYKNAAALAYPSFYEGFGIPLLEAMSCGCPVIAGNTSSIPEVAGDAALLFAPASADELAGQLRRIVFESGLRARMTELGRHRCALFSWNRCLEQTLELYKELLQDTV